MVILTKLEAAHRQLVTAIRLYFDDGDIAAIHTLTCAAREIYEKHCEAAGVERMFTYIESANPEKRRRELWDILNGPRNFLKHPDPGRDLAVTMELTDDMNATMLLMACHDCTMLCKQDVPPEADAFCVWFLAARWPTSETAMPNAGRVQGMAEVIEKGYPGIRQASLGEQKRFGREMIAAARRLKERDSEESGG